MTPYRLFVFLMMIALSACSTSETIISTESPPSVRLTISAAANVTAAFTELGEAFTQSTGIGVDFNFASSGQLTQQILQGAPVDVFVSADESFVDTLEEADLVLTDTRAVYAIGRLTLWTRADSPLAFATIADLANPAITSIAIANPETAPYGVAAREALQSADLWDDLQDKLVFGENISQTLQYAESGNADVAIVALSLSIPTEGKWVLLPEDLHTPLIQALAVITTTQHEAEARQFALFVNSEAGREIMRPYGFILPGEDAFTQDD